MQLSLLSACCPRCQERIAFVEFLSGNTIGATQWSDGWLEGPMVMRGSGLLVCPHCRSVFHDDEAVARRRLPWTEPDREEYEVHLLELGPHRNAVVSAILTWIVWPGYRAGLIAAMATMPLVIRELGATAASLLERDMGTAGGTVRVVTNTICAPRSAEDEILKAAPGAREPDGPEFAAALAAGIARSRGEERSLRLHCWWRINDPVRRAQDAGEPSAAWQPSLALRQNLDALRLLLDPDDVRDRLLLAEIARELGEPELAMTWLRGLDDELAVALRGFVAQRTQRPMPVIEPTPRRVAMLWYQHADGRDGTVTLSPTESVVVGRGADCAIRTDDPEVADRHLRIRADGDDFVVEALSSSNAVYINNQPVRRAVLHHANCIRCGTLLIYFSVRSSDRSTTRRRG